MLQRSSFISFSFKPPWIKVSNKSMNHQINNPRQWYILFHTLNDFLIVLISSNKYFFVSFLNRVPCVHGLRANVRACSRGLRANVPKACQLLIFKCQRGIRLNLPKGVQIFRTFLLQNTKGYFYNLLLCKKFYVIVYSWYHSYTYHMYIYLT